MTAGLVVDHCKKPLSREKSAVCTDSRKAQTGCIFIAIKGTKHDGHRHLNELAGLGLSLIVTECDPPPEANWAKTTPWIRVSSSRKAWSYLASSAYDEPQTNLKLIAVTGTNGKTSTVWMVGELLRTSGIKCMTVGTLGAYIGDQHFPTGHTTPDPDILFSLLRLATDQGVSVVAMEASSHALAQSKLAALSFDAMAFTSFSRDHLDFHESLEDYWKAKWQLFTELGKPGALCAFSASLGTQLNLGTLSGRDVQLYGAKQHFPSVQNSKDSMVKLTTYEVTTSDFNGSQINLSSPGSTVKSGFVPYFADHALDNFTAAEILASRVSSRAIPSNVWRHLRAVPGRLEQVLISGRPGVIVDYAHTPDALEKTLRVLKPLCRGKLHVVFGCGGNRDKGKRPIMGGIASTIADHVIITSDNPRHEDPAAIANDICGGTHGATTVDVELDRELAIRQAIEGAKAADLILIAGKGHETEQIFADRVVPFDDRLIAKKALLETK